jgi:hypothetical protein
MVSTKPPNPKSLLRTMGMLPCARATTLPVMATDRSYIRFGLSLCLKACTVNVHLCLPVFNPVLMLSIYIRSRQVS